MNKMMNWLNGLIGMKVKICGMRRPEDVLKSEESGADLIGFINIERSKRFVKISRINELLASMKNKKRAVLVIEPEDLEDATMRIKKTGIKTVQLHSLSKSQIKYLKWMDTYRKDGFDDELKVIRVIGISEEGITEGKAGEIKEFAEVSDAMLFDYEVKGKSGGTGKQIPLDIAVKAVKTAKGVNHGIKIFLAGGMNVERLKNEKKILDNLFDYVDVNSGVEDFPGVKNPDKIQNLCEQIMIEN